MHDSILTVLRALHAIDRCKTCQAYENRYYYCVLLLFCRADCTCAPVQRQDLPEQILHSNQGSVFILLDFLRLRWCAHVPSRQHLAKPEATHIWCRSGTCRYIQTPRCSCQAGTARIEKVTNYEHETIFENCSTSNVWTKREPSTTAEYALDPDGLPGC